MNTQTLQQNTGSTPVVSLVLLKAGGHQMQRIPGRKGRYDFRYVPGAGHVRSYTSIEQFHQEELEIRSIPQACAILTRIGPLDALEGARSALERIIADTTGHAPTKRERLLGLRAIIDSEVSRLESRAAGTQQTPADEPPAAPMPTPDQQASERRRAELRRMGEQHTRSIVKELGLRIPLLNNYAGMIEAVVELERDRRAEMLAHSPASTCHVRHRLAGDRKENPARECIEKTDCGRREGSEERKEPEPALAAADPFERYSESELLRMPYAELKALAARRGIQKGTRQSITEELVKHA